LIDSKGKQNTLKCSSKRKKKKRISSLSLSLFNKHSKIKQNPNQSLVDFCPSEFQVLIGSFLTISSTFDSLFRVLSIFPSRYLSAIGLSHIFSLDGIYHPFGAAFSNNSTHQRINTQKAMPFSKEPSHEWDCHPL